LRKEAWRWLKALRANDAAARDRLQRVCPRLTRQPVLRDVQYALAVEYGLKNWKELRLALQKAAAGRTSERHRQAADDFVHAYEGDASALQRLNQHFQRSDRLSGFGLPSCRPLPEAGPIDVYVLPRHYG